MLKLAFPIAAVIAVAAFTGSTMISRALPEGASLDNAAISGGKLIMSNPVMTGQIGDTQSYSVSAVRAIQDLSTPSVIRLEDIVADFPMGSSEMALLNALSGIYNSDEEFLSLDQPFTITTETGMTASLNSAEINIKAGELKTDKPVSIDTNKAAIQAESLKLTDKGAKIIFEHNVRMTIKPGAVKSTSGINNDT